MDNLTLIDENLAQKIVLSIKNREIHNLKLNEVVEKIIDHFIIKYNLGEPDNENLRKKVFAKVIWKVNSFWAERSLRWAKWDSELQSEKLIQIIDLYNRAEGSPVYFDLTWNYRQIAPDASYDHLLEGFEPENWKLTGFWMKRIAYRLRSRS